MNRPIIKLLLEHPKILHALRGCYFSTVCMGFSDKSIKYLYKQNLSTPEMFESVYKSSDHMMTHFELAIFSRIFGIRFIVMRNRKYPNEIGESFIQCLNTTQTLEDWYILLSLIGYEKYEIIVDTSIYADPTYRYRYIFTKTTLPSSLYNKWLTDCPNDHKLTIDPNNKTLLDEEAPVPEMLQTARHASTYPINLKTGKVIPFRSAAGRRNCCSGKRIFVIKKIIVPPSTLSSALTPTQTSTQTPSLTPYVPLTPAFTEDIEDPDRFASDSESEFEESEPITSTSTSTPPVSIAAFKIPIKVKALKTSIASSQPSNIPVIRTIRRTCRNCIV